MPEKNSDYKDKILNYQEINELDENELKISDWWDSFKRRKKLIFLTSALIFSTVVFYTGLKRIFRPTYLGTFSILISDPISAKGGFNSSSNINSNAIEDLALNNTSNDIDTLKVFLKSRLLIEDLANSSGTTYKKFIKRLSIVTAGQRFQEAEGILEISLTTKKPKKDELVLEKLKDIYLQTANKQRQKKISDGLSFLNSQTPILNQKVDQLQNKLSLFREKNNLIEPNLEGISLKERESDLDRALYKLEDQKNRLIKVRESIEEGTISALGFQEAIGTNIFLENGSPGLGLAITDSEQNYLKELKQVETELSKARLKYTPQSLRLKNLEQRQSRLKPLLKQVQLDAVDSAIDLNSSRLNSIKEQNNLLKSKFSAQPDLIKEYESLQQKLLIAKQNLSGLVTAREKFQLQIAQNALPWQVISPVLISPDPIKPRIIRNITLGAFLSLFIGVFLGLYRDRKNYVYYEPKKVEQELNSPYLGHLPFLSLLKGMRENKASILNILNEKSNLESENSYESFFYQEAIRNIFTSIRFLNPELPEKKLITITSTMSSEGKTTFNSLFCKTYADMGNKVLIIDGDMRKSQLHKKLNTNNILGLSNYLANPKLDIKEIIKKVKNYDNWDVITAGIKPPDPTKLLGSKRMKNLIKDLKNNFDYDLIIFDPPPILGLSDANLIADVCDGIVLIVSINKVNRNLAKESLNRIKSINNNLMGVVTNALEKEKNIGSSSYGYYNNYEYYSSNNEDKVSEENQKLEEKSFSNLFKKFFINKFNVVKEWLEN